MNVLLEIKESKAEALLEVLESLPFVKMRRLSGFKAGLLKDLKEGFEQIELHKKGLVQLKSAKDLLDEL